ncbi:uncharacterized protein LOC142657778 isoform X4 [Rhinoderma darwinii]|uniref:uncharacterized protein LOC142657778 isoform X4 n=1 Tax=Rhinoderma darwinii TaxID=43563 RepID=UPI003F6805DF
MSSRRGGNPGISTSDVTSTYELRSRRKNVVQQTDPQTPGSKDSISGFVRRPIKNAGKDKKDSTVEQNAKNQFAKSTTEHVESEFDDYSDDNSDYSNSSRSISQNNQPFHLSSDNTSSKSSGIWQPSQPRPSDDYTHGSPTKLPFQARQHRYNKDDKDKTNYYREETRRETFQNQQNPKGVRRDEFNKTSCHKEERGSWSTNYEGQNSLPHNHQPQPKETTKLPPAQTRSGFGFSDDEDEATRRSQTRVSYDPKLVKVQRMNNPEKSDKHKGTCSRYLILPLVVLLAGLVAVVYMSPLPVFKLTGQFMFDEPQMKKDLKDDFEKLTSIFTDQSPLMLNRSRRIMELHLKKGQENTEPVIILLTGALDAEQTLLCLGTQLADIYSSAFSGSSTLISGSDLASKGSEEVKEYIDDHLSAGFQATTRAAVLHRLELLPAGSLLILYKYCDHESAVFKNVMLLLTALLDDATLAKDIPLKDLEEKVRSFLIEKLIDSNNGASHDGMDKDKFSGVWSRISHVVLPVFPEKNMEKCVKKTELKHEVHEPKEGNSI